MFSLLYVDDEPGLLELGRIFLEGNGEFRVTTALSGEEGLGHLAQQEFDAVVSDYQMPEMNGLELLKRVRKSHGNIPFILFTGRGREEVVIEAINMGVDFYLQKGGDPKAQFAELALKIRQAVNRRRAETALSDSERRLADIINFLPDATFAIDTRGVVIAWNRAMEQMTGVRSDDVLGKGNYAYALPFYHNRRPLLIDLILNDDPAIAEKYPFVKREGKNLFSEITIPHFNGGRGAALWFTASPLFNRKGEMVGAIESIREITERKQAEEKLVSANREYTNLLDQIQDVYYFSDTEGRLVRASRSMATLLGYNDITECLGRSIADDFYFNPSDRKQLLDELNRKGSVTGFEVLLKKKDGEPVLIEASSHLCFDPAGKITGVEGTFHDITGRKRAEEELRAAYEQLTANEEELKERYNELAESGQRIRESEQKYRTVFETTGTAMLMIEEDATISLVNSEFARMSGYSREEIENRKKWTEFVVAEDLDRMLAQHRKRRGDRDSALTRYEFRFLTRSGEKRDIFLSIDVIPGTTKSVASLLDITEKKKTTDELQAANEQLIATDEELRAQYDELALSEKQIRLSEKRLSFMLGFYEHARKSERELLAYAIEGAGIVTGSPLGYLAFLNGDESELSMYAWSKNAMAECSMTDKPLVYRTDKTGLWGEAVRQRRAVITNDYAAPDPAKKGYPEGHPHIVRHMNIPVTDDGHIVLVAGVANKSSDYTDHDTSELTLLMQALWTILKRRRAEEIRLESEAKYRNIIDHSPAGMHFYELRPEGTLVLTGANPGADRILGVEHRRFIGKTIEEAFPLLAETEIPRQYRKVAAEGGTWQTDHVVYDGETIHGIYAVTAFRISPGAMVATFVDITARKKAETGLKEAYERVAAAEEKLREQYGNLAAAQVRIDAHRQQLEEIASMVPGVVYQFYARPDGSRGMYYASARSREFFGLEADLEGFFPEFTACVHPDDRARFLASIEDAVKREADWHFEGRFNKPFGDSRWFEGISSPVSRGGELVYTGVILDITDRKQSEIALLDSERKYRTLFETADEGIWTTDAEFRTVSANLKMQELFGYTGQEMAGRPVWDFVPPDEAESMKQELFKRPRGIPGRYERRWVRKDGTILWCFTSATPVFSPDGTFAGSFGMFTDITERRQMEDALRESEAGYRNILRTAMDGFCVVGMDGSFIDVNEAFCQLLGYSREEVLSLSLPQVEIRETPEDTRNHIRKIVGKGADRFETRFLRKDKKLIDVEVSVVYSPSYGGQMITFSRDITDRKRAEAALRESGEKFRAVIDQSFEFIGLMTPDGILIEANRTALALIGIAESEVLGRPFWETPWWSHSPELKKKLKDAIRRAASGETVRFEASHPAGNGSFIMVDFSVKPVMDREGRILYLIPEGRDITERKQKEDELRLMKISADRSSDEVFWMDFAGNILYVNDAACRTTGYSREEFLKMKIFDLDPDFPPETWNASVSDLRKRKTQFITTRHRRRDGSIMDVEIVTVYVNQDDREYSFAYVRDITERKRTEDALFRSQQMLQIVLDSIPQRVFWKDRNSVYLGCNRPLAEDAGYQDCKDLIGKDDYATSYRATADIYREDDRLVMETGRPKINYEERQDKPDGSQAWLRTTKVPLRNKNGSIIGVMGTYEDITERKRAEVALRESEEKYRTLVESSFDGIAIHQDGLLVYVNRTGARLLGSDNPETFIGKPAIEIVAPEFRERIQQRVQDAPQDSQDLIREQFLRADGTLIDVDVTTTPSIWKGKPAGYVTFRDITAQIHAEEALRESEEKYRMLVEKSRDGVFIVQDGRLVFYNKALTDLSGYSAEELDGRPLSDLVAPDDLEMVAGRAHDRAEGKEVPELYEFSLLHKDRARRIRVRVSAGTGTFRGQPASLGMFYDVTEDRRREEALHESEEKYRALVESTSDFIWEVDATGAYTYVSPQVRRILGYEPEELLGKTPFDIMSSEERQRVAPEFDRCVTGRLPIVALENRALKKDGSIVILETSGMVRTADNGRYLGYRGIDRDITARNRAEQALREKTDELNRYFSASLDLFCIADTDGYFRRLNPEWEKTLGYTLQELEGHRFYDFIHPDDLESTLAVTSSLDQQQTVLNFTNRFRHRNGTYRWLEWRSLPAGKTIFAAARDITERRQAEERTSRLSTLKQDLLMTAPLEDKLKRITDGIVNIFDADFARIWIAGPGDLCDRGCIHAGVTGGLHQCRDRTRCLHLVVSSGRYTHTDGSHRRVPFGAYKIGRIAGGDDARFITNDVTRDPRVHDHAWAASLGLVSFAGFRLLSAESHPVGVLAFFSRHPVLPEVMDDLDDIATTASQVIQTSLAEQALRDSEARLSSILHGSPVLQFVIDRNHRVISWNKALEEYSGIRAEEIIGTDGQWRAFYPEKRPVLADLLVDGDTGFIDTWYKGKFRQSEYVEGAFEATDFFPQMGSRGKWLSFTGAPVRDVRGSIIGAVETLEDITERVNAETALRRSDEWTRTILNTAQAGIILVDVPTHQVIDANNKALELIGRPRESVIGSVCHRFICPAEEGKCPVTDCGQTVDTSERVLIRGDGTQIPVLKTVVPVTMVERNILVESFVDISDHKRSESAIREANRKLNLLSSITRHDVANQLTAVQGYTELAASKEPDPVVKDYLGRIQSAVETIQHQIEFTRQYQELGVHAPSWFRVDEVIRGAKPEKIRFRCSCDAFEVYADPMIGRVFFNLFDNAMKYGGHVTSITAGCKKRGSELVITFADNGVGIPPDEKQKIFEKGYGKNTGFGLFLVREILAITGIAILETGTFGKGARFEIIIPHGGFRKTP
jgi:PAS domain S-box-containing protein